MESTYGGRFRDAKFASFEGRIEALADAIDNAFSSGNVLLIPAFCLQRAQDLLFDIRYVLTRSDRTFAKTPIEVVIDSPLAQQYMEIFGEELCRRQTHKTDEPVHRNRSLADRLGMSDEDAVDDLIRDLYRGTPSDEAFPCGHHTIRYVSQRVKNDGGKKIIISGSGMCRGGPVMSYLRDLLPDPRATIMLTGYMAPGTPGALIEKFGTCTAEGKPVPFREIKLGAKTVETADIKAKVIEMKSFYSGHADQHGLLDFVFRVHGKKIGEKEVPATVFINHGDCQSRNALREAIRKRVRNRDERQVDRVEIPSDSTKWFDLDAGDWLQVEPGDEILSAILAEQERTNDLLRDMASILVMTVARKRKIKKQADPRIANGR
jgi:metallo-beta-lactamase family protein